MSEKENSPATQPPEQIVEYKKLLEDFKAERENYSRLWKVFSENVLLDDFKYSRWASLAFIFIPTAVNVYFLYRPDAIFKNTIRISSILACYFNLHHQLNGDINALMKKDTPLANRARSYIQNIAKNNLAVPDFSRETFKVIRNISIYYFINLY